MKRALAWSLGLALVSAPSAALAATINVGPADGYAKIEAAGPGDEVVLAPGKYTFRLHLTGQGTPSSPIVIRAADPNNPPVFDLTGTLVEDAPGSYTAGDRGRGCWQFDGATSYRVSGVVFTGCSNAGANSAGIRYYNTSKDLYLKDCVFRKNDNGLTGGTQDSEMTVEWSEFDGNGNLSAPSSAPSHNIYIYGGTFTLRYSYVHDPIQGQNFHIRAQTALVEANWLARGKSYEGDLMTDDDYAGSGGFSQTMTFRSNVIVQGSPANHGQIIAMYNDAGATGLSLHLVVQYNTVIAANPHAALVHLSNADATTMDAVIDDNVLVGTDTPYLIEDMANGQASGKNNWMQTGAMVGSLTGSVLGADPGLDAAYRPKTASPVIGAAAALSAAPTREYFYDEKNARQYRVRASAMDIGAFESTTMGAGTGPYGTAPPGSDAGTAAPDGGGVMGDGGGGGPGPSGDGGAGSAGAPAGSDGGCGCGVEQGASPVAGWPVWLAAAGIFLRKTRRKRR